MYFKSSKLILVFFLLGIWLVTSLEANALFSKNLPKTKKTVLAKNSTTNSNTKKDDKNTAPEKKEEDLSSQEEKEEKINPSEVYKLIAIYRVNNTPRALIKNAIYPEEGTREYKTGEYLDNAQSLLISRISFNPTARVELTDTEGFSYLLKPENYDEKTPPSKTTKTFKSTYSFKAKKPTPASNAGQAVQNKREPGQASQAVESAIKKEEIPPSLPQASTTDQTTTQGPQQNQPPALAPQAIKPASEPAPSSTTPPTPQDTSSSSKGTSPSTDSGLGRDRPKNPFGE